MKRFTSLKRTGEKGFTLIELLVVVAILGILAAVVIPNVGKFMGKGTVEAANTEAHNVQTAVLAAMSQVSVSALTPGTVGPGHQSSLTSNTTTPITLTPEDYFTGNLQATYNIGADGSIIGATAQAGGKWNGLTWSANTSQWQ